MNDCNHEGTALLLMDLMPLVVPTFGGDEAMLERLSQATVVGRSRGVTVIYVRVIFRDGYPEVSRANKIFSAVIENFDFTETNPALEVHPAVAPHAGDILVTKRRVSAFAGSDLDLVLRARHIHRLVLGGVATSGVVLSTVRQAADLDFELVVLSDGCADGDAEVHRVLLERIFPSQAHVMTVDAWIASLDN